MSRRSRLYGGKSFIEDIKVAGYQAALEENNIAFDEDLVLFMDLGHGDQHLPAFKELMSGNNRPTAVCCVDDGWALYVYRMAHRLGIRIPDDLSVVGYNDVAEASHAVPEMTTLQLPLLEMGALSVKRLLEKQGKAGNEFTGPVRTTLPGKVISRGSHIKK
jgi:LacI family transcriptional regulator